MSARLCHGHHRRALEALRRVEGALFSGLLTGSAPLQIFVRLCFSAFDNPSSQARTHLGTFIDSLTTLRAASVAARPDKPAWLIESEIVLHVSERLLGYADRDVCCGSVLAEQVRVHRVRQRECGTYSTPNYVADSLFDCVIEELRRSGLRAPSMPARIVDLSVEGGHFPLVALARAERMPLDIIGFDRDPEAISLATVLMKRAARAAGASPTTFRARVGDSVRGPVPPTLAGNVDAVFGNPPWKTIHPTDEDELRQQYAPMLCGRFDVYLAFMLRADALLRPGGAMAFVLPSAFLYNDNAARVRTFLLERYDPVSLFTYRRRTFVELPSVAPIVIVLRKKRPGRPRKRSTTIAVHRSLEEVNAPKLIYRMDAASIWSAHPRKVFSHINSQASPWESIRSDRAALAELGVFSSGARLSARRKVRTWTEFSAVSAKNLTQFHTCDRNIAHFRAGDGAFSGPPPLQHLSSSKVFFQTLRCVSLARRLIAAEGGAGQLACSTAGMFIPARSRDVGFVSGLLNSTLANAWYKSNDSNHVIKISVLAKLEIPLDDNVWRQVAALAEKIEACRKREHATGERCGGLEQLKRLDPWENSEARRICALYGQLDDLIFDLYRVSRAGRMRLFALSGLRSL
jgi:hypothetical protein